MIKDKNTILITGSSGFIWYHLAKKLLKEGHSVIGLDNENNYYDPKLKQRRRALLSWYKNFYFIKEDIRNITDIQSCFLKSSNISQIYHLAAQAGVEYNQNNPKDCIENNILGFINIVEEAKKHGIKKIIYASSSSIYGNSTNMPETYSKNRQASLYAVSKKTNELLAEMYAKNTTIAFTWIRFFSVYGPRGRPDMAYFKFVKAIYNNQHITIYGDGSSKRDRTYIDDIVNALCLIWYYNHSWHEIFNLGREKALSLKEIIWMIEETSNTTFQKTFLRRKSYDAEATWANIQKAKKELNRKPEISFKEGIKNFIQRYKNYTKNTWK